jgi:long-chain-fatty-acid--CoA ligase ACSBG
MSRPRKKPLMSTGRIKELIITAGGENVAPVPIEDNFKISCPACSNIMLLGENQRFMAALITLKVEIDMKTGLPSNKLTNDAVKFIKEQTGEEFKTSDEACKSQKVFDMI